MGKRSNGVCTVSPPRFNRESTRDLGDQRRRTFTGYPIAEWSAAAASL